ncbi:MAG TPA: hypothetical protein VE842_07755 [Pyrinomonadaceae bacterium]|nr:hypothetical protein [Pyrinomonadaceae bacterium]
MVTAIKRGANFDTAFEIAGFAESASMPGLFLLYGPSPMVGGQPHTHFYLPLSVIQDAIMKGRLKQEAEEAIFASCCGSAWGTLFLIAPTNLIWLYSRARHIPFLKACLQYWELFNAEGNRYSLGSPHGQGLWEVPTNLKHILARRGISLSELNSPHSSHYIMQLIQSVLST